MYLDSTEAVKQAVRTGLGAAVVSAKAVEDFQKSDVVVVADIEGLNLRRNFYFVYNNKKTPSPVGEEFIRVCCNLNDFL